MSPKKRGTKQQPDPSDSTALLVADLALSIHTSTEHAQQPSPTQTHLSLLQNTTPAQGFQDGISQFRFAQKVSANTSIQPRTSNKGLTSICLLSRSPPETDHSNLLISCTSSQTALFYHLIPYSIQFFPNSGASSFLVTNAAEENQ